MVYCSFMVMTYKSITYNNTVTAAVILLLRISGVFA